MATVVDRKVIDLLINTQGEQALKEIARGLQQIERDGKDAARSLNTIKGAGVAAVAGIIGRELVQAAGRGITAVVELNEKLAEAGDKGAQQLIGNLQELGRQSDAAKAAFSEGLRPALNDIVVALTGVAKESGLAEIAGRALGGTMKVLATGVLAVGLVFNRAKLALAGYGDALRALRSGDLEGLKKAALDVGKSYTDIFSDPAFEKIRNLWNEGTESAAAYVPPAKEAAKATKSVGKAAKEAKPEVDALAKSLADARKAADSYFADVADDLRRRQEEVDAFNRDNNPELARQARNSEIDRFEQLGADAAAVQNARNENAPALPELSEQAQKAADDIRRLNEDYKQFAIDAGAGVGSVFGQFITGAAEAKRSLGDLVKYAIVELTRLAAQEFFTKLFGGKSAGDGGIGQAIAGLFQAKGGAWEGGVQRYAQGGVVGGPTLFRSRGGLGLMGEAGPEAIVPLRRNSQGSLGVASSPVVVNITNNAGVQVRAIDQGQGQIAVLIEQARRAVTADLRAGGGPVSSTLEQVYGLRRASA